MTDSQQELEHWRLEHPQAGLVEVYMGPGKALQELDQHFPRGEKLDDGDKQILVLQDGEVVARLRSPQALKLDVSDKRKSIKEGKYDYHLGSGVPKLNLLPTLLKGSLFAVRIKDKEGWVYFDPPPSSVAEKKAQEMEESRFKRWLYPIVAGLGKGFWALAVILLGPLIGRLVRQIREWLAQYLPDWQMPSIPLPEINLPSINWPSIPWPEINLPSWDLPDWLDPVVEVIAVALDYSKVWVPILIGIALGIAAVRGKRKSDERKKKWAQDADSAAEEATEESD